MNKTKLIILIIIFSILLFLMGFYMAISFKCAPIPMRIYKTNGQEVTNRIYPCGEVSKSLEKNFPNYWLGY